MTSIECNCPPNTTSKPTGPTGEDNLAYVISDGDTNNTIADTKGRTNTDVSVVSSTISTTGEDTPMKEKEVVYGGVPRCYSHSKKRATCTVRRIGSHEGSGHAWKFTDPSLKVSMLINVVGLLGLVMCVTIVISISEAKIFEGDNVKNWEWYLLRTLRRIAEAGVTGTMAYLVRRTPCLF
jgi:hypothetical protein